jgi:exopolysaccharide biosynthesis polyprenyl glycosylphosphotransferase
MIKEQNQIFRRVQLLSDLFLVTASFFIGYFLRDKILDINPMNLLGGFLRYEKLASFSYYAVYIGLLPVLVIIWGGLLTYFGMYKFSGVPRISQAFLIIFKTTLVGFIIFGSYVFILRMQEDISRLFIGFTFLSSAVLISTEKIVLFYAYKAISKRNKSFRSALIIFRRIIIVGTNKRTKKFIELINNNPDWGIKIFGILDMDASKKGKTIAGYNVLGILDDIPEIIHNNVIDEIVFIVPRSWLSKIEDKMLYCESAGLKVYLAVNLFDFKFSKAKQTDLQGFPLLAFDSTPDNLGLLFMKRIIDFTVTGIGFFALLPVYAIIAIMIKATSSGPVFYKQLRCGLHGRRFMFYKFRTMVENAEMKLKEIIEYNEMEGPVFKMTDDPRITKIGKLLRKFSLDELPQLWNVLKGDMSLVGPRPPLPREVENYDNWQRRKLSMRPGITCLWQAGGRNDITDFKEWMRLDLEYIDNWSLGLDFRILLKTIPVVLLGTGAK